MTDTKMKERPAATAKTAARSDRSQAMADALSQVLANTYTLYLKTHNYHWNVTGPHFGSLHALFEQQYTELAAAVDTIAERIRALGHVTPGSYSAYGKRSEIREAPDAPPKAMEMVRDLAADNETLARLAEQANAVAEESGDDASGDMMIERMLVHGKSAWMLRSHLE